MSTASLRPITTSVLIVALVMATMPAIASAPAATLTGTVYGGDVQTPLAGATVVATDANGLQLASQPTAANGAFTIPSIAPGRTTLALQTKEGSFAVATPVVLAPGQTRGVRLALKAEGAPPEEEKEKKKGGAGWTGGTIAAMSAVLLGFATAAVVASGDDDENTPASPSTPSDR